VPKKPAKRVFLFVVLNVCLKTNVTKKKLKKQNVKNEYKD